MDGYAVAVWTLVLGILSLLAHVAVFPWVYAQRRAGVERTKSTVRELLSDPQVLQQIGAAVVAASPKLDSLTASGMGSRRWEVQAAKDAKAAEAKATILSALVGRVGEVWSGLIWKWIENNELLPDSVLVTGQYQPIVEKALGAWLPKINSSKDQRTANVSVDLVDPSNPYMRR